MKNNVLSKDSAMPTSQAVSPSTGVTLLSENVAELSSEGSVDVGQKPNSTPIIEKNGTSQHSHHLVIPHTLKPSTKSVSVSNISPLNTPTNTCPSSPTLSKKSTRINNATLSNHYSMKQKLEGTHVEQHQPRHVKRSKRFRVYVRNNMGTVNDVKVRDTDSVRRVKEKISMARDIDPQAIHLFFNGKELTDERITMGVLGVVEGSTLTIVPRIESGQMEVVEGSSFNEESLYEKIMSQLSENQVEELYSGTLNKPLSFVTTIGGKRVLVRLKPANDAAAASSGSNFSSFIAASSVQHPDLEPWTRGKTSSTGVRKDAQWRKEKQIEHTNMRSRMDEVREKLRLSKLAKMQAADEAAKPAVQPPIMTITDATNTAATPVCIVPTSSKSPLSSGLMDESTKIVEKGRCFSCSTKLGPIVFPCKCLNTYCSVHRHDHSCKYDYRNDQ